MRAYSCIARRKAKVKSVDEQLIQKLHLELRECILKVPYPANIERIGTLQENVDSLLKSSPASSQLHKLQTMLPTNSLLKRKSSLNFLLRTNQKRDLPPAMRYLFATIQAHHVGPNLYHILRLSQMNMINEDILCSNGRNTMMRFEDNFEDTCVVMYFQLRFFFDSGDFASIPNRNARIFYSNLVDTLFEDGIYIVPLVLPCTNVVPAVDFPGMPVVSQHTYGLRPNTLHQKIAYLGGYSYLDPGGFGLFSHNPPSADSISGISIDAAKAFHKQLFEKYVVTRETKFPQATSGFRPNRETVYWFFPLQTLDDTVAQGADVRQDVAVLEILSRIAGTDRLLLVKKHPLDNSESNRELLRRIASHRNCIIVSENAHDLIECSEVVFCVNSGVGIEALLHMRPVVSFGASDYRAATLSARSLDELRQIVSVGEFTIDSEFLVKFLYYFFNEHVVDIVRKDRIREILDTILHD